MNVGRPRVLSADNGDSTTPLVVSLPTAAAPRAPVVFASPHSGRIYPQPLMDAARIGSHSLRQSEDAFVDTLIDGAPAAGIATIAAQFARAYLDVNRGPWELDPKMFADELPAYARSDSARVAAGLGVIPRTVGGDQNIYARKLNFAEAVERIESVHRPYHKALAALVDEVRARHGLVILIDWHSMPAIAAGYAFSGSGCDMVLGDRFGASCSPSVSRLVERELQDLGYSVARNAPYAGGYTTEHYGRPAENVHALQIEMNRALYLDPDSLNVTAGFAVLEDNLGRLFTRLATIDWWAT